MCCSTSAQSWAAQMPAHMAKAVIAPQRASSRVACGRVTLECHPCARTLLSPMYPGRTPIGFVGCV